MSMSIPLRSRSTGSISVPVPVHSMGRLYMKTDSRHRCPRPRGPVRRRYIRRAKRSLSTFSVKAASAEPPPSPAPSGMILRRYISTGGRLTLAFKSAISLHDEIFLGRTLHMPTAHGQSGLLPWPERFPAHHATAQAPSRSLCRDNRPRAGAICRVQDLSWHWET